MSPKLSPTDEAFGEDLSEGTSYVTKKWRKVDNQ